LNASSKVAAQREWRQLDERKTDCGLRGVFIAAASWVPLLIVAAHDRYAMPVGLGLLALAGSLVGGVVALVEVVRLVIHASRASKARS
jgi:hypothetical protein